MNWKDEKCSVSLPHDQCNEIYVRNGGMRMGVAAKTIYRCMKKKKLRQKAVAASVNENPRQINQQLRRVDDIKVERFCKYADAIGYDVAVIDRESGEVEKIDPAKNNL